MKKTYTYKVSVNTIIEGSLDTQHEITIEADNEKEAEDLLQDEVHNLDIDYRYNENVYVDNYLSKFTLVHSDEIAYRCPKTEDMFEPK